MKTKGEELRGRPIEKIAESVKKTGDVSVERKTPKDPEKKV